MMIEKTYAATNIRNNPSTLGETTYDFCIISGFTRSYRSHPCSRSTRIGNTQQVQWSARWNPSVITRGQLIAHHHEHVTQFKQLDQVHFPSEQFKVIGHPPVIMLIA
jgi:hypothetical protein